MLYLLIALALLAAVSTLAIIGYLRLNARYRSYRQQAQKQVTEWKALYQKQQSITSEQQKKEDSLDKTPDARLHERANNLF